MLFRLGVKEDPKEFFNYEKQLKAYTTGLTDDLTRMIVVKGIRRIGKSSLTRVGLRIAKPTLYLILDPRSLHSLSMESVADMIAKSIEHALEKQRGVRRLLKRAVSRIDEISISGIRVHLRRKTSTLLVEVVDMLDEELGKTGGKAVIIIDEAQQLAQVPGITSFLAHIYDYDGNVKLVLTGSQVGLLNRMLRTEDPKAPLFGRPYLEIILDRLSTEESLAFLERGFAELGIEWRRSWMEEAVDILDGIPGWLTMYGYYSYTERDHRSALSKTLSKAEKLVLDEIQEFLSTRGLAKDRYKAILQCLSLEPMRWTTLWRCSEYRVAARIPKSRFHHYLRTLLDYSLIEKTSEGTYRVPDPLLGMVARKL